MKRSILVLASLCLAALAEPSALSSACAQTVAAASTPPPSTTGAWQLETIVLQDGKTYRGLLQSRTERQIDFAEIVQPPGKPTYALVRGIAPAQVARLELLPQDVRLSLADQFRQLRHRAAIEAGRMDEVRLREETRGGRLVRIYDGDWFTLVSTADDESTRRCVVRVEQIFRAFRTLLPPRAASARRLHIDLFASQDEFRQQLRSLGLELATPAFYIPRESRIVAASELSEYARRLGHVRSQAQAVERQYQELEKQFAARLQSLSGELKQAGFSKSEIASELSLRKAVFNKERDALLSRNAELMRQNEARFADVTSVMFRRLYHEALHAWLDNLVFPAQEFHVPRWLHEGLAQVFEGGQLEGDTLRLDAADPQRLAELQVDLLGGDRMPLAELLVAEGAAFSGSHDASSRQRYYLYAWGITHHLIFEEDLLSEGKLHKYVAAKESERLPLERFERLTGRPLSEWEAQWRAAMLVLPSPAR